MIKQIKSLFARPTDIEMARAELEKAKRELLESLTLSEYYLSAVEFQKTRISRLTAYLK
jgi:hypothetical protein